MKLDLKKICANYRKYSGERVRLVLLDASMECRGCGKMTKVREMGMYASYCRDCRLRKSEYKSEIWIPTPEQRIGAAKEMLGHPANKNENLVMAKAAQLAIKKLNKSYEKHPRLTERALRRIRDAKKRPKAGQSSQGTKQCGW